MVYIPKRINLGIMMFMICLTTYVMRVNLSLNIVAMTQGKDTSKKLPDYGKRFNWTEIEQGHALGAYYWGYMITSFVGGMLADQFGAVLIAGGFSTVSAILTIITPFCCTDSIWTLFVIRFFVGFMTGVTYPCCHCLISKWAPKNEKSKFVATLMGGTFGTVVTFPITAFLTSSFGWKRSFYIMGVFVIFVIIIWFLIVRDTPQQHSGISTEELELIETSLAGTVSTEKRLPPYKDIVLSLPFWALAILHYGNLWGLYFLINATPKFLSDILKFNLKNAGMLSSLPHIARLFSAFGFGALADMIRAKDLLSITAIRKVFCILSHVIPGLALVTIGFFEDPYICVAIMTVSLGFNGAAVATNLPNSQDLAPNFAGTLYGTINGIGTSAGSISPLVVGAFIKDANTKTQWIYVFFVGTAAYCVPTILFWIFGSGEVQKWNNKEEEK